jgi:cell wall-associated NlpC family hydrolase
MADLAFEPSYRGAAFEARLQTILARWNRTPYLPGQCCEGQGVDCVRFVCAVWDELLGRERHYDKAMPQDAAWHDRAGAFRTALKIRRRFRCKPARGALQPGDVIVVGPRGKHGGPGHVMLVGAKPWTVWHATQPCVHRTGLGYVFASKNVLRAYRPIGEVTNG